MATRRRLPMFSWGVIFGAILVLAIPTFFTVYPEVASGWKLGVRTPAFVVWGIAAFLTAFRAEREVQNTNATNDLEDAAEGLLQETSLDAAIRPLLEEGLQRCPELTGIGYYEVDKEQNLLLLKDVAGVSAFIPIIDLSDAGEPWKSVMDGLIVGMQASNVTVAAPIMAGEEEVLGVVAGVTEPTEQAIQLGSEELTRIVETYEVVANIDG